MMAATARPQLVTKIAQLREILTTVRRDGKRIGLVPTMGALHEGHLSLARASRAECGCTVVSIYVNPTQFGPNEDLDRYPRTLESDLDALAECGAELAFVPSNEEMYGPGYSTWVEVGTVAKSLEGQSRPVHFRGVATVVLKLLNIVVPDVTYFGQKDYQQTLVVRRMIEDLNLPVELRVCPTVREPDGLAMSSRNAHLSAQARKDSLVIDKALQLADQLVGQGQRSAQAVAGRMRELLMTVPNAQIDYIALVDPDTLEPVDEISRPALAAIAMTIENIRLIDNCLLDPEPGVDDVGRPNE
jgi:pantoate--beta-alanine ligase